MGQNIERSRDIGGASLEIKCEVGTTDGELYLVCVPVCMCNTRQLCPEAGRVTGSLELELQSV